MRFVPESLPEIGCELSRAMCRNPMCGNFGIGFDGDIPEDGRNVGVCEPLSSCRSRCQPVRCELLFTAPMLS